MDSIRRAYDQPTRQMPIMQKVNLTPSIAVDSVGRAPDQPTRQMPIMQKVRTVWDFEGLESAQPIR